MSAQHIARVQAGASIASALIFMVSVYIAWRALLRARINQKESTARSIFNDYLKVAIQYPGLAFPESLGKEIDYVSKTIKNDRQEYERYEWFVSLMIFSMKEILDIFSDDFYWIATAERQISYHLKFIVELRKQKKDNFVKLAGDNVNRLIERLENKNGVLTYGSADNRKRSGMSRVWSGLGSKSDKQVSG